MVPALRLIFILLMLVGAGLAFAYPAVFAAGPVQPIGSWRVYDAGAGGSRPETVSLTVGQAPLAVSVEAVAEMRVNGRPQGALLTLTVGRPGRTLIADAVPLSRAVVRAETPQSFRNAYWIAMDPIPTIEDGDYTFTVGPGDIAGAELVSADVSISTKPASTLNRRMQPIGLSLLAVGFIGTVIAFRRRPVRTIPEAPRPRWGRGPGA